MFVFQGCCPGLLCSVFKGLMLIEPLDTRGVLLGVKLHLDGLQWFHIKDVVSVVQWRLLIIKWWKAHPLEVPTIALLAAHHDPHGAENNTFENQRLELE